MEGEELSTKDQLKREKKPHESLVVRPHQEFTLFDPRTTDRPPKREGWPLIGERLLQYITLETEILPGLPIEVMVREQEDVLRREAVTPFEPKLGYQVSEADYELESRIQKLLEIKREDKPIPGLFLPRSIKDWLHFLRMRAYNQPPQEVPTEKAPLRITIDSRWSKEFRETLLKAGLAEPIRVGVSMQLVTVVEGEERTELDSPFIVNGLKFQPEVKEKLKRLRIRLSFPGYPHTLEAKPVESELDRFGNLIFCFFYPISNSREEPLATASFERVEIDRRLKNLSAIEMEGLMLMVPSDFKKLGLIKASFCLSKTTPN